ncbi:hypothetical protein [Streptomyces bauhiniae]|uniref:hypothetical protein n=1 Tax=Streptomyces bauhiniae TaxID=2340725 RepID=UPI001EF296A6|nr:hypothetical protein [Streptomyces bauhiniae]
MQKTALIPYAYLPPAHHDRHVLTSTVDVFGAAHWLLAERAPQPGGDVLPFDALVVSVHPGGDVELTELSAVRARWPYLDRLPDGGFVVAASRARRYEDADQVQVFDVLGRETLSFSIGDAIEHLLVDRSAISGSSTSTRTRTESAAGAPRTGSPGRRTAPASPVSSTATP